MSISAEIVHAEYRDNYVWYHGFVNSISVIITTKDRPQLLMVCINSLLSQTRIPNEIIVVDNSSDCSARKVVRSFKTNTIAIRYTHQSKKGIAFAKNRGIQKAQFDILAFIDDDCAADCNWVNEIDRSYKKNIQATMGQNINGRPHNIFSCLEHFYTERSVLSQLTKEKGVIYSKLVDPKNFSIKKSILQKSQVVFDETFGSYAGFEELDFSRRLERKNIKVLYNKRMMVHHFGRTNFILHSLREFKRGRALYFFYKKWETEIINDVIKKKSLTHSQQANENEAVVQLNKKIKKNILDDTSPLFKFLFLFFNFTSRITLRMGFFMESVLLPTN